MEAFILNLSDIESFEEIEIEDTFDLTVDGNHNYYLSTKDSPILVHNSGKDEFVNYIATGLSKLHGWKFGVCGFEEPASITVTKLIEKHGEASFNYRKNPNERIDKQQFKEGLFFVNQHFKFINTDEVDLSVESIIDKAIQLVKRYGINGLIISPWNCFEHNIPVGMSETLYVSQVLGKLLRFQKMYNVHCFLIAHPTKINKDKITKKYEIPTLYNISGSANFFNKTHNGITIDRDFETGIVTVYIQKVKWSWLGKIGWCSFSYDTMTRQYTPIESSHKDTSSSFAPMPTGNYTDGKLYLESNEEVEPF